MDFLFDISGLATDEEDFSTSKKDVLKYLKIIGVDTRFISYTPDRIYINNLRFSRFSRKKEATFNKQYPEIEVVRNKLFQKICAKSSKHLALEAKPNSRILMPKDNYLVELLMEPYTRKYGVELVYEGDYDLMVNPVILDDQVNDIFEGIFKGEGLNYSRKDNEIYPLVNVSLDWINSFLQMDGRELIEGENTDEQANSFSEFLDEVAPQYKENVLSASEFIESKI
jgi:hypothetical protein